MVLNITVLWTPVICCVILDEVVLSVYDLQRPYTPVILKNIHRLSLRNFLNLKVTQVLNLFSESELTLVSNCRVRQRIF